MLSIYTKFPVWGVHIASPVPFPGSDITDWWVVWGLTALFDCLTVQGNNSVGGKTMRNFQSMPGDMCNHMCTRAKSPA